MNAGIAGKVLIISAVAAGCLSASTAYTLPGGSSDVDGAIAGNVEFFVSNCNGSGANCTLNVEITSTEQVHTGGAGQLISGVSFTLMNAGTDLTALGTVGSTISNGSGGAVTVVNSDGSTTTTTTTPGTWQDISTPGGAGSGKFDLTTLSGGSPQDMIIGPGPYTNLNSSISGHSPSLEGTVEFTITGITGLTTSTDLRNVSILMGTGPDATESSLTCTAQNGGSCSSGVLGTTGASSTPEPFSFLLAGGGLIGISFFRRRSAHRA